MGITLRNIRAEMRKMKEAGALEGVEKEEVAAAILDRLFAQNSKAFADPTLDWDRLLAFVERLVSLVLKIMALFP
jgi:hypothetical protein